MFAFQNIYSNLRKSEHGVKVAKERHIGAEWHFITGTVRKDVFLVSAWTRSKGNERH